MGVYIKGMEMPTVGRILIVLPSGRTLEVSADSAQNIFREAQAVPVPPHGRLIDADALYEKVPVNWHGDKQDIVCTITGNHIKNAPTIIPASGGHEDENKS